MGGGIVVIKTDSHTWGTKEDPAIMGADACSFYIIRLPDMPRHKVAQWLLTTDRRGDMPGGIPTTKHIVRYTLDLAKTKRVFRDRLRNTGRVTIKGKQFKALLKDHGRSVREGPI